MLQNLAKPRLGRSSSKSLDMTAEMPKTTRKSPYVGFEPKRELSQDILTSQNLSKSIDGEVLFKNVNLTMQRGDKIVLLGPNDLAKRVFLDILAGGTRPDSGTVVWGQTTIRSYLPSDNADYFVGDEPTLVDWLRKYSEDKDESFIRGFLGKMLFSRDEALKKPTVLSGGEKVRCMLARMMWRMCFCLDRSHKSLRS